MRRVVLTCKTSTADIIKGSKRRIKHLELSNNVKKKVKTFQQK